MQAALRTRHRVMWVVIGVIVAAALLLSFYWREPIPATDTLPVSLTTGTDQGRP